MLEKTFQSLNERQEYLQKVSFPLQEKVIACANNCIESLKIYMSNKSPMTQAELLRNLDEWRNALDECERQKLLP